MKFDRLINKQLNTHCQLKLAINIYNHKLQKYTINTNYMKNDFKIVFSENKFIFFFNVTGVIYHFGWIMFKLETITTIGFIYA